MAEVALGTVSAQRVDSSWYRIPYWDIRTLEKTVIHSPVAGALFQYGLAHEQRQGSEHKQEYFHPYVNADETVAILAAPKKENS